MFRFRTALISAFFVFICVPFVASAQSASGVGLKPSLIEEGADPGEQLLKDITITNLSDQENTYYLLKKDIVTVAEGGRPVYADPGREKTGFELTEWLDLEFDEVTLLPGEAKLVKVAINVPEDATPGSHFGGIFISMQPPRLRNVGASVGYEVANIVSIRISGDVTESALIRSFKTNKFVYGETNVQFTADIENKGNVLIRPTGIIDVYNMVGAKVVSMDVNDSEAGIFPYTKRDFSLTWKDQNIGFGRYQAEIAMSYGDDRRATIVSTVSFWILPMNIITPALIILGVLLLTSYIAVRMYVRRTVASMSAGRRLVRRRRRGGSSTLLLIAIVMLVVTALFLMVLLILFA